jgi:transposase-like protein
MRRRYTKTEKLAAVAEAAVNGTEQASDRTGIPESTIRYWLDKPEFAELRAKTREEMRDGFKVLVHRAQERLTALVDQMEPRDLTVLLGVATDKTLLLSGDATSRTENRSLIDGLTDDEKRRLRGAIAEAARAEAGGPGDGDGVEIPGEESPATA